MIPARLQKHTVYLEEEIRIARRIEEMAEEAKNAMKPLAEMLYRLLSGEKSYKKN